MAFNLVLDERKNPFPDAMPRPGGTVVLTADDISPETYSPAADTNPAGRVYFIRVSSPCRFAVHDDAHTFDPDTEAFIDAGEIRTIRLADARGDFKTLSIQCISGSATVYLEEVR